MRVRALDGRPQDRCVRHADAAQAAIARRVEAGLCVPSQLAIDDADLPGIARFELENPHFGLAARARTASRAARAEASGSVHGGRVAA